MNDFTITKDVVVGHRMSVRFDFTLFGKRFSSESGAVLALVEMGRPVLIGKAHYWFSLS